MDEEEKVFKRDENKIYFGSYYINNKETKEPIEWDILEERDGNALIISHYILDTIKFDDQSNNYEKSYIRNWLNNDFYSIAFNDNEKTIINTTTVDNGLESIGDRYNIYVCKDTTDKLFLLSYKEVTTYYKTYEERQSTGTNYSGSKGLFVGSENGYCYWWLRSPRSNRANYAYCVFCGGLIYNLSVYYTSIGVRPACWIKIVK